MEEVVNKYYITGGMSAKAVRSNCIEVCQDTSTDLTYNHIYDNLGSGSVFNIIVANLLGPSGMCMGLLQCYNKQGL